MPLELQTPRQVDLIVSSLRKVFETNDINKLSSAAYKFLYLSSGFIAHCNFYGFCIEYSDVESLKRNLARNYNSNQWNNFQPGERDYDYMMQKKEIYNRICALFEGQYELKKSRW